MGAGSESAVKVVNIKKKYRNGPQALNGLSLTVSKGEVFSLLGSNGAGKSTLIGILTTCLKADEGSASIFGADVQREEGAVRRKIACVAQRTSIDLHLTLAENMMFWSRLYRIPSSQAMKRMDMLIECFDLSNYTKLPVAAYSGGIRRRLDIAVSMMSNPEILFLDEPTVGMDIQSRRAMWEMVKSMRAELCMTVFLTTHYLEEAKELCDTICIMKDGKDMVQAPASKLCGGDDRSSVRVKLSDAADVPELLDIVGRMSFCDAALAGDTVLIYFKTASCSIREICCLLIENNIAFVSVEYAQPSIEDVFIRYTDWKVE